MAENSDREQRTEEATPRRREEARERGQVALSTELVAALGLAAGIGALAFAGAGLVRVLAGELEQGLVSLPALGTGEFSAPSSAVLLRGSVVAVAGALAAVLLPTFLVTALACFVQVGLHLAPKALEMEASKLDPVRGLQRVLSLRGLVRTCLSTTKILLIAGAASWVAWRHMDAIARAGTSELGPLLGAIGIVLLRVVAAALMVILALAVLDAFFQRFQHARDLRMTRAEVREEQRMTEGDPHVRARIRSLQRELATRRMMSDVPRATVVVTNPTHYAVALLYEREGAGAPRVVAKGVDHLARKIKEVAARHGVRCHEDVPLARALYARVALGQEIPEELYAAVAAVLAGVYRLQGAGA